MKNLSYPIRHSALTVCTFLTCLAGLTARGASHSINITSTGFSPSYLEVTVGDRVYWWNVDDDYYDYHSTRSYTYPWNSGPIDVNYGVYLDTTKTGTYDYVDEWGSAGSGTLVIKPANQSPPNDQCSGAIPMTAGTVYTVNTAGATSTGDPSPSCATSLGNGVWYTFTPSSSALVTVSTCGSDFDTALAVYTGSCGSLVEVPGACNDDNGPACSGATASLTFSATAGTVYRILAGGYGGGSGNLMILVTAASTWQEVQIPFDAGFNIAHISSNLVFLVDRTNDRLLTLDTDTGSFIHSTKLAGKTASAGYMCFSLDNQFLYVPLASAQKLQVISLTNLATWDIVPLSIAPGSLAAGSDGNLYAIAGSQINRINPATGQSLGAAPYSFYAPVLKASASGTRLYVMELGLSGGTSMIGEYAVNAAGPPTYVASHFNGKANDKDFVIAEDISMLYSTSGGVYGIGAWNMFTRTYSFWPYDSAYGAAVAMVRSNQYVYGASADYYSPRIRSFDRVTGAVAATYDIYSSGRGYGSVLDRSLQVTPNGCICYLRESRRLGLIGASNLSTNVPATAEVIDAGTNRTMVSGDTIAFTPTAPSPTGADSYSWCEVSGPGQVIFSATNVLNTTAQIIGPGDYVLQITRVNGLLLSCDRVNVTVLPRPIHFDHAGFTSERRFEMRFSCDPGWFMVEGTSNFLHWDPVTNVLSSGGQSVVTDPQTNLPYRFYRIRPD